MESLKLVEIRSRRSTPASSKRFHLFVSISHVLRGPDGLSSRPDGVSAVGPHRWTTTTHWGPRSSSASLCRRNTDLWITCHVQITVATDRSISMYQSCCWVDAFEPPPVERIKDRRQSVTAVIASCWCRSRRAHRCRPEPRHIYRRWRIDEVTRNEDDNIMFRHSNSATTTLYPTISAATVLQSLMSSLILSRLDYCNTSLSGISGHLVRRLQSVMSPLVLSRLDFFISFHFIYSFSA